jgi:hypothetical protein
MILVERHGEMWAQTKMPRIQREFRHTGRAVKGSTFCMGARHHFISENEISRLDHGRQMIRGKGGEIRATTSIIISERCKA